MAPASSGAPAQPSAAWDTRLASVELMCSRLLELGLSALGQGLGTTGYVAAQGWYHAEFEGISPAHLADLERMLQRTVDGHPPRHDGAAMGWLQEFPYRLLAGRPSEGGFGLLVPREHLVARGANGPPNWWKAFVHRCCMAHVTLLHLHRRFACRNQKSCLGAYGLWLISHCAVVDKTLQQQQALYPQPRAGLVWHGLCFYAFVFPSIHCKPCCVPHSAPLKLLFLGSSPLPVISACSSQLMPHGVCDLQLRA
jgi:hypothetical protein